jgi:hypothetical protein
VARFEDILSTIIFHIQKLSVHFNQQLISRPQSVSQLKGLISNHVSRSVRKYPQLMNWLTDLLVTLHASTPRTLLHIATMFRSRFVQWKNIRSVPPESIGHWVWKEHKCVEIMNMFLFYSMYEIRLVHWKSQRKRHLLPFLATKFIHPARLPTNTRLSTIWRMNPALLQSTLSWCSGWLARLVRLSFEQLTLRKTRVYWTKKKLQNWAESTSSFTNQPFGLAKRYTVRFRRGTTLKLRASAKVSVLRVPNRRTSAN